MLALLLTVLLVSGPRAYCKKGPDYRKIPATSPVRRQRVFVTNASGPRLPRSGFHYPRYDARLHHGDEVQLISSSHKSWLSVTNDPFYTLRGRTVALKDSSSGKFCAVTRDHLEGSILCDQDFPPFAAWFEVAEADMNISLKNLRSQKMCSDKPKGIICKADAVSNWELFSLRDVGNGRVKLRGNRKGKYCADWGYGIICDRDEDNAAEFEPVTDSPLVPSIVPTMDEHAAATFVVHRSVLSLPAVSLLCKGAEGKARYLAVDIPTGVLRCSSATPWEFAYARVTWWDMKTATLRVPETGLYVKANKPAAFNQVKADNEKASGWALWKVFLTGGYETVRPLVRGVNLGNWFLLEKWMAEDLFYDVRDKSPFKGKCPPVDEYGLMKELGPKVGQKRMEQHWASWITENDIVWLGAHGINAVRVPFGYWMVFPSPPFVDGQMKYLDKLFQWCEKHSIAVLLDFHGLKGSQTGNPTSGNCGACERDECGKTNILFLKEHQLNLAVIAKLAARFSQSPAFMGFAIANEVSAEVSSLETMAFYQQAYDIIRKHSDDALVVLFATFNPSTYPFPNFRDVAVDVHIYFGMGFGSPSLDHHENLERAREAVAFLHWDVLVGEWSMGANGQVVASDWEGARRDRFFKQFAKMQLQAWETHSMGWFYWSYKTRYPNSTWNYRDMCMVGWLPGCTPELQYAASTEWREHDACTYAYLDGVCRESWHPPPETWWIFLLAVVGAVLGAAAYGTRFAKPTWVAHTGRFVTNAGTYVSSSAAAAATAATAATAAASYRMPQLSGWQSLRPPRRDSRVPMRIEPASRPFIW